MLWDLGGLSRQVWLKPSLSTVLGSFILPHGPLVVPVASPVSPHPTPTPVRAQDESLLARRW